MSKTEQKSSSMSLVFQTIGLLALAYLTFMGLNYITNGNLIISGVSAFAGIITLFVIVNYLSFRKGKKTTRAERAKNKTVETILLGVYAVLFIVFSVINTHSLIIDFVKKDDIRKAGLDKIDALKNLKENYLIAIETKKNNFTTTAENAKSTSENTSSTAPLKEVFGSAPKSVKDNEFEQWYADHLNSELQNITNKYDLDSMNRATDEYAAKAEEVFKDWKVFKTAFTFKDIDQFSALYLSKAKAKMSDFEYQSPAQPKLSYNDYKANLSNAELLTLCICLAILFIIHLCILAPYLSTDRPTVSDPIEVRRDEYEATGSLRSRK